METHRNRELELISTKNLIFFSPTTIVPAVFFFPSSVACRPVPPITISPQYIFPSKGASVRTEPSRTRPLSSPPPHPSLVRAGRLIALHGATASPTAPLRSIPDEGLRGALARLKDARDDAGSTCEHADMCRSYLAAYDCAALPAQSCGTRRL